MDLDPSTSFECPVNYYLNEQRWYWGSVDKEELNKAMSHHPTGTFAVRDSSTPGEYTLTVRVDGTNRLVKILIYDDRCGFTTQNLDFTSVVELIEYYRHRSLEDYNPTLKTSLRFPLEKPGSEDQEKEESFEKDEEEDPLVPYRVLQMFDKYDSEHQTPDYEFYSTSFVLQHFIEQMAAEVERSRLRLITIQNLLEQIEERSENYNKMKRGFDMAENFIKTGKEKFSDYLSTLSDKEKLKLFEKMDTLEDRYDVVCTLRNDTMSGFEKLKAIKEGLNHEDEIVQKHFDIWTRRFDHYVALLVNHGYDMSFVDRTTDFVKQVVKRESAIIIQNLLKVDMVTSPFDWLTHNNCKEYAAAIVNQCIKVLKKRGTKNINGIFLIRPSASKPGCYAMAISMNEKVLNCLIDYRPPSETELTPGYGFFNTNLFYSTLTDFVRYYSQVTLKEHNPHLATTLRIPALRLAEPKKHGGHTELFGEIGVKWPIDIDLADCMSVSDGE
ncbi:unnamed protein product [Bursaphelenchus xylophilus]|uniref:(pine wood nematode) hypothetical protein n=1 Tax=Bursaphelenchus xylophilus TaxID=6326 RepID=A0A1I7RLG9_BURXY|nr:unnamed protein product [Bursaphelenchus xylophilus]CAG9082995.1 unnamed protein product [Bursaphelenchus xylophilus]